MGALRTVVFVILGLSFLTFVALFGRLPALRRTPISFLYKVFWVYIPQGLTYVDSLLTGGRGRYLWNRAGGFLLHENHPLVLIFFVALLSVSELIFVSGAWQRLNTLHRFWVPLVISVPYIFLYASIVAKSFITPENVGNELKRYPYDNVIFHPGRQCRTCQLPKPARSKHCNLCNACVARHDHHCIWLTTCVGRHNHRYFLGLLFSLSILLIYGAYLGYVLLNRIVQQALLLEGGIHWSKDLTWSTFLHLWAVAIVQDVRVGIVFLLAAMTVPLAVGFFSYHIYLIWAGTTTNETAKWSDWREDIADGLVFKAKSTQLHGESDLEPRRSEWPMNSDQFLVLTDGQAPTAGHKSLADSNSIPSFQSPYVDLQWIRVRSLKEVDNIYDLGFWGNLRDVLKTPVL